jgi:hypothetical protein
MSSHGTDIASHFLSRMARFVSLRASMYRGTRLRWPIRGVCTDQQQYLRFPRKPGAYAQAEGSSRIPTDSPSLE